MDIWLQLCKSRWGHRFSQRMKMGWRQGLVLWLLLGWFPDLLNWRAQSKPNLCHQAFCDALGGVTSTKPVHAYLMPSLAPWHNRPEQPFR